MKATRLILAAAFCAALSANAAVVRKLPAETVVEGESISLDAMGANSVRSSNTAVFGAVCRHFAGLRAVRPRGGVGVVILRDVI